MRRLLALIPDPLRSGAQPGGVLASSQAFVSPEMRRHFDVRIVDTTMRAYPVPSMREKSRAGARRAFQTFSAITRERMDVAFAFCSERLSFYEKSSLLLAAKAGGARTFLSPRSGMAMRWLGQSAAGRAWVRNVVPQLDGLVVQSQWWAKFYVELGVPADKVRVWYNSVETTAWAEVAARRDAGRVGDQFRYLFLGWAIPEKGLPELIEAGRLLAARGGPPFVIAVAGDGAVATDIKAGPKPAWLEMLGWVKGGALREQLALADALVLPSHAEGFPNAVLEAMACALPVVVTPVGAVPEVVLDGETGLLVPVGDSEQLAIAMDKLRREPALAGAMGRAGLVRARSRFDRADAAAALVKILAGQAAERAESLHRSGVRNEERSSS